MLCVPNSTKSTLFHLWPASLATTPKTKRKTINTNHTYTFERRCQQKSELPGETQPHNCYLTFSIVFVTIVSIVRLQCDSGRRRYWTFARAHERKNTIDRPLFDFTFATQQILDVLFVCTISCTTNRTPQNSPISKFIWLIIYVFTLVRFCVYLCRRGLTPPHRVKSISMATFTTDEIEFIRAHGNELCAKTWLGLWDPKRVHTQDHRELMIDKYERKR